jgi:ComF family protein
MVERIARIAHHAQRALLDLLFPPRCVTCRRVGEWFCVSCRAAVEKIQPPFCERCGRLLPQRECIYCQKLPLHIDGIRAVAFFEGNLREAIHAFKYKACTELAQIFGGMLSDYLSTHRLLVDAVVAVPLHAERERARGYNQSLLLARALAVQRQLPVWEKALMRVRDTRPQVELNASERRENVRAAFAATSRVAGARVLLIDDVCTTGATMDACSVALKDHGAQSVWGLALARPRLE